MQEIRTKILKLWKPNISSEDFEIDYHDLEKLYNLYNIHAFNSALDNKIDELYNETTAIISVTFGLDSNNLPPVVERYCGVRFFKSNGIQTYDISLSPWILAKIFSTFSDYEEQLNCILLAFEHELLHFITLLWNYADLEHPNDVKKGIHGELFHCTTNAFFERKMDLVLMFSSFDKENFPRPVLKTGRYIYWKNSCYLDSLTSVLYFSSCDYFRKIIFNTNTDLVEYSNPVDLTVLESPPKKKQSIKIMKKICSSDAEIDTEEEFRDIVKNIQAVMFTDYMKMITLETSLKCYDLRSLLLQCYPDMKNEYGWETYTASDIYELFVEMFPMLLIKNYSIIIRTQEGKEYPKETIPPKPMFTFREFMDPLKIIDIIIPVIQWDLIDTEILVFKNEGTEIQFYNNLKPEIVEVPKWTRKSIRDPYEQTYEKVTIEKARVFDEYILNGKYELVGVLLLHGVEKGEQDTGAHYTSVIKMKNEDDTFTWVEYNDIGQVWKVYDKIPKNKIFTGKNGTKPEMFFYSKL
jgi:hypothetical protein